MKELGKDEGLLTRMVEPFFEQGAEVVYLAACCNRLFAGVERPKLCRGCRGAPDVFELHSLSAVTGVSYVGNQLESKE